VCLFATTTNKLVLHNTDVIWAGRVVFILEAQEIVGRDTRFWFKSMTISCRDLYACVCFLLLCILFAVVSRCEPWAEERGGAIISTAAIVSLSLCTPRLGQSLNRAIVVTLIGDLFLRELYGQLTHGHEIVWSTAAGEDEKSPPVPGVLICALSRWCLNFTLVVISLQYHCSRKLQPPASAHSTSRRLPFCPWSLVFLPLCDTYVHTVVPPAAAAAASSWGGKLSPIAVGILRVLVTTWWTKTNSTPKHVLLLSLLPQQRSSTHLTEKTGSGDSISHGQLFVTPATAAPPPPPPAEPQETGTRWEPE